MSHPTQEEALAELERRKENRRLKEAGEPKLPPISPVLSQAKAAELKEWAEVE